MKFCFVPAIVFALALGAGAAAQDASTAPASGQNTGSNSGGGYGQCGGRGFGGMGGGMAMMGRGVFGTVTTTAADHYTIRTGLGDIYTINFSATTRMIKQPAGMQGPGGGRGEGMRQDGGMGRGGGRGGYGGTPPQEIKASDIKVGDGITAMGQIDAGAKSVGAMRVMLLDPDTAKRMLEMEANFGKTWLQGKVTAIDGAKITFTGALDNADHAVVADENTTFRKRRDPVTLADVQVGDTVRVDGAVKDGTFTATTVNVEGMMGGEQQGGPPNPAPQQ